MNVNLIFLPLDTNFLSLFVLFILSSLIKYNKKFQELLSLNLINYKLYSGRYIIFVNNQKGKEYDSKYVKLLYEGEYLNGKRNGYGKEYFYGQIIFEGEYLNGNKLKGKGYDYNDYNKEN